MDKPFVPIGRGGFREWSEGFKMLLLGAAFLGAGHVVGAEIGLIVDSQIETVECIAEEGDTTEKCEPDTTNDGFVRGARIGAAVGILAGYVFYLRESKG